MQHSAQRENERGFTLIELMIVVAIIAILAGILIPNFVNARAQAQTAACESNLRSIATALELYYADNQAYPASGNVTPATLSKNGVYYLNNTPKDPAATDATALYAFTSTAQSGSGAASYTITCPGVHVGSTLAKLQPVGGTTGTVCGASCADSKVEYLSGQGLQASP